VEVGRELLLNAPDHVRVEASVRNVKEYRSPLSWKNSSWHHAVPFSLEGMDEAAITREVERLYGLIRLAIPEMDVPVLVIALPTDDELARRTKQEAKVVQQATNRSLIIPTVVKARRADLAASYQRAIVRALVRRTEEAARQTGANQVAVVGGVAANSELRAALPEAKAPPLALCTDNAAMIASAARYVEAVPPPRYLALDAYASAL